MQKMKHVRIGIVGCDGRPGSVADTLRGVTGGLAEIVAGVEIQDERFEAAQKKYHFNEMKRYYDVESMLQKESLNGIVIGTPNFCHLANLKSIANLKIPVLLEKPLDSTWDKICDVVRFCRNYQGKVLIGHCMRYAPILVKAKEMIQGGMPGKIGSANFVQYCHYGNSMYHSWRREMRNGGGMMIEKATHDIDIMQWLLNSKVKNITSSGRLVAFGGEKENGLHCHQCAEIFSCPESPLNIYQRWVNGNTFFEIENMEGGLCSYAKCVNVPDDEINLIVFENGIHGTYSQVFYSPRSFRHRVYTICGSSGAMEIDLGDSDGGTISYSPRFGTSDDKQIYKFDYLRRNHYNGDGNMCRHFYQIITQNIEPETTVEQAFFAEASGYAALLSEKEDRKVAIAEIIPPDLKNLLDAPLYFA